jgi:hypothetical protein
MSEWPPFLVTFTAKGGVDGIRALRRTLKFALRECGLRCVDAYPLVNAEDPNLPAQLAQYCGLPTQSNSTPGVQVENAREAARRCLRSKLSLSDHERSFLNDMTRLAAAPTPRQRDWLRDLYARAKRVGARTEGVRA